MVMMNRKGELPMGLRTFIIILIVTIFSITLFGHYFSSIMYSYGIEPNDTLSETMFGMNKSLMNVSYSYGGNLSSDLRGKSGEQLSSVGGEAGVLKTMYEIIKSPIKLLNDARTVLTLVGDKVGIPEWVLNPFLGIMMIVLSAILIGIILKSTGT